MKVLEVAGCSCAQELTLRELQNTGHLSSPVACRGVQAGQADYADGRQWSWQGKSSVSSSGSIEFICFILYTLI